jgi:hypothetical protein
MKVGRYTIAVSAMTALLSTSLVWADTPTCGADGVCTMDAPSQAPSVTLPTGSIAAPQAISGNSCDYASDGKCDDRSYSITNSGLCAIGTDESVCNSN